MHMAGILALLTVAGLIGALLGLNAKDLMSFIKNLWQKYSASRSRKRASLAATHFTPEGVVSVPGRFYGSSVRVRELSQYVLTVNGRKLPTTIYFGPRHLGIDTPPLNLDMRLLRADKTRPAEEPALKAVQNYGRVITARLVEMGVKVWDEPQYRLMDFSDNPHVFCFSETRFRNYRFTSGLLADELEDALIECKGDPERILRRHRSLPIRRALLPDPDSLVSPAQRECCGGIGVVFAMRRKTIEYDDYAFPVQLRSDQVSDQRGLYAVIPKGFHGPSVDPSIEVNVHWTVFRELYEELAGGEEVEHKGTRLKHDWYFDECEALRWFKKHEGWRCEVVAFGLNALAGNYEFAILLVIEDPSYWEQFGSKLERNWEAENVRFFSSTKPNKLAGLLLDHKWAGESLFHIAEALWRLRAIDREHVALPEISRP
jgi:hypothetical protein